MSIGREAPAGCRIDGAAGAGAPFSVPVSTADVFRYVSVVPASGTDVLKKELPYVSNIERAQKPKRLPVVFTREETKRIFANLEGAHWVVAGLLYGSGLRLMECL